MRFRLYLAAALWVSPVLAYAEPTPSVQYLMHDPVSIWDWGMLHLKEDLEKIPLSKQHAVRVLVQYNWEANRLEIEGLGKFKGHHPKAIKDATELCKETISEIRKWLGINPVTGKPYFPKHSYLSNYFLHFGYDEKSEPRQLPEKLDSIVELSGRIFGAPNSSRTVECKGPLVGKEILFSE